MCQFRVLKLVAYLHGLFVNVSRYTPATLGMLLAWRVLMSIRKRLSKQILGSGSRMALGPIVPIAILTTSLMSLIAED